MAKELHQWEDIEAIGQWLCGARAYYLQPYVEGDDVIMPVFSSYSKKEMLEMKEMLSLICIPCGCTGICVRDSGNCIYFFLRI